MLPHQHGIGARLARVGKAAAPMLSRLLARRYSSALDYGAQYLALLEGKGGGAGWDLRSEVTAALRFIPRGDALVVDVGANAGAWSDEVLQARPEVRIIQFEPNHECQPPPHPRATLLPLALSDREGAAILYRTAASPDTSSLHVRRDSIVAHHNYEATEVEVTTLDSIYSRHEAFGLQAIAFMKMDIEGHELAALRGAAGLLESGQIMSLSFEFGSSNLNSRTFFKDLWDMLVPLGYAIWRVLPGGHILPVEYYHETLEHFRGVSNYIASRRAPVE